MKSLQFVVGHFGFDPTENQKAATANRDDLHKPHFFFLGGGGGEQ